VTRWLAIVVVPFLTIDQRGFQRPIGSRCDIGAVEYFDLQQVYLPLIVR
jgi:hypothetical protein